jgi:hypothetical protein
MQRPGLQLVLVARTVSVKAVEQESAMPSYIFPFSSMARAALPSSPAMSSYPFSNMARAALQSPPDALVLDAIARRARPEPGAHTFTEAELYPVECDLVQMLDDHPWPREDGWFRATFVRSGLQERGHSRDRIDAMLNRLVEQGVFEMRRVDPQWRIERDPERYVTSRSRWSAYVEERARHWPLPIERGTDASPAGGAVQNPSPSSRKPAPVKPPSEEGVAAWYLKTLGRVPTQKEIAEALTRIFRRPIGQGQVSRWLKQVKAFLGGGSVFPEATNRRALEVTFMDPQLLDRGQRQDGRTKRQRGRRDDY